MKRNCLTCLKEITVTEKQIARGRGRFCSHKCKGVYYNMSGKNNPRWNGGKTMHDYGYILVKAPKDHPYKTNNGYVREHRLVMEKHLGRYLLPSEDVDHLNGIKTDNRIENLQILSRSEHVKLEHKRGLYKDHLQKLNGGLWQ